MNFEFKVCELFQNKCGLRKQAPGVVGKLFNSQLI